MRLLVFNYSLIARLGRPKNNLVHIHRVGTVSVCSTHTAFPKLASEITVWESKGSVCRNFGAITANRLSTMSGVTAAVRDTTSGAGPSSAAQPAGRSDGRTIDVAAAEREYLGEREVEKPPKPDQLTVTDVNFELDRNRKLHHTTEYELKNLFVRRGQDFDIDVIFNKAPVTENLVLELTVRGARVASINRGTVIRLPFSRSNTVPGQWGVRIGSADGTKYSLVVVCPVDAMVGRYDVAIRIVDTPDAAPRIFKQKDPIFVLFNAWCQEDTVFMAKEEERNEYVLNEQGFLFFGSSRRGGQYARPWVFGQFEDTVTNVVFDLLERNVTPTARRDPVIVSRKMSSLMNYTPVSWNNPDVGVLIGNWSGEYDDGVSPGKWTGSTAIFEKYAESKDAVKYGQCWVFSGVLNTAMRCLGVAVRSVTNFASAHDTNVSMTIDSVIDSDTGEEIDYLNGDSVWNFHVWNEVWMGRPDLIPGMGGWQVVDATPQETSEGVFQTGPAPVTAIKQGLTYLNYDTKFCFAEVNADRINWVATKKGGEIVDMKISTINKNSVGKYISTKRIDAGPRDRWFARSDITNEYKYTEGSKEERMAVERAVSYGTKPNTYRSDNVADDVNAEILLAEKLPLGDDFDVKVAFVNKSQVERNIDIIVNVNICYYTGVQRSKLLSERSTIKLPPGNTEKSLAKVLAEKYVNNLLDQTCMKIYVFGKVLETGQQFVAQDAAYLTPPEMKTDVKVVGHQVEVNCEFTNPLPIPLTNCVMSFEGARLVREFKMFPNDVPAKGVCKQKVMFSPRNKGLKTLVIDFDSKQVANVTDIVEFTID